MYEILDFLIARSQTLVPRPRCGPQRTEKTTHLPTTNPPMAQPTSFLSLRRKLRYYGKFAAASAAQRAAETEALGLSTAPPPLIRLCGIHRVTVRDGDWDFHWCAPPNNRPQGIGLKTASWPPIKMCGSALRTCRILGFRWQCWHTQRVFLMHFVLLRVESSGCTGCQCLVPAALNVRQCLFISGKQPKLRSQGSSVLRLAF